MDYKYTAIILSKVDIGEVDRIYTVYTKEAGKIAIVARGVRKHNSKLAGMIEPITQCELFVAKNRGRGQLTGAIAVNNFISIKNDIELLTRVFYVFGVIRKIITDEEKDEKIFSLLSRYLAMMERISPDEKQTARADVLTTGLMLKLLDQLGYKLETERCAECGGKISAGDNYFSMKSGGVMCQKCRPGAGEKIKITEGAVKAFRIFGKNKLENLVKLSIGPEDLKNIKLVMDFAVRWIAG